MPSLANCGLSTDIRIVYHDELFGGASKNVPNVSHLKSKIVSDLLRRNVTYVMIDIEHWNPVTEMAKLITVVVRTLKEGVRGREHQDAVRLLHAGAEAELSGADHAGQPSGALGTPGWRSTRRCGA
ncbi:hypothetical protein [Geminicoccus flavidas]|uniref:hypothetical protein n=1 Tax=Geminicoccus flavidas TaxID=2506407 RepID=UPI001358FC7A|nr:hypothetical protein [Geminicoccus flavidas]